MDSITVMKDTGAFLTSVIGTKGTVVTTASGAITGSPIDRTNYESGVLVVSAALAQSKVKTSTFTVKVQHSETTASSTFVDFKLADGTSSGTLTVHSTASVAPSAVTQLSVRFSSAAKYVRSVVTPTLPTGSTVTLTGPVSSVFVFGGKKSQ